MRSLPSVAITLLAVPAAAMELTSRDVTEGAPMPTAQIYTRCGGQNVSPQLAWSGAPAATKSYVVTMIDLSVKPRDWSHWIIVGIPASTTSLARNLGAAPPGAQGIVSNFGDAGYDGPCPPPGTGVHRYQISVWAMPTATTAIAPDAPADGVLATLGRASLAHASLTATAGR